MRNSAIGVAVGLAAVSLVVSSCGGKSSASDPGGTGSSGLPVVKVAYEANEAYAPLVAGVKQGFFKAAGVDVDLVNIASASATVPLVMNGQVNVGNGSGLSALTAVAKGLPIRVLSSWGADVKTPQGTSTQIVAAPGSGIHSLKQLDGKKLGVDALSDGLDLYARDAIDKAGGDASTVTSVEVPFTQDVQALKSGNVAAVSTVEPYYSEAVAAGGIPLGDPYILSLGKNMSVGRFTFVDTSWFDSNRAAAEDFLKGLQRSFSWSNSHPTQLAAYASKLVGESVADVEKVPQQRFSTVINVHQTQGAIDILRKDGIIKTNLTVPDAIVKGAPTD